MEETKKPIYSYQIPTAAAVTSESKESGKKKENLWRSILNNVAKRADMKDSHLILLGDRGNGKRSLIRKLDKDLVMSNNKQLTVDNMGSDFSAVDFSFLFVKDLADREIAGNKVSTEDNLPRLNVWTLQDSEKSDMLEAVLKPGDLAQTVATIVLSLDAPWEMKKQLSKWIKVLQNSLFKMIPKMETGLYEKMKKNIETHIKTYDDPELDESGKLIIKTRPKNEDGKEMADIRETLELAEGVLKVNLGIPIVVICNKVDLLVQGEKAKYLAENMDFIQHAVREYAL